MSSGAHERAPTELAGESLAKVLLMEIPKREIMCGGATKYKGNYSSKEGNSVFKPRAFREKDTDRPTIIFEAGLSESLGRLGIDPW
jgi:hypothetical protein